VNASASGERELSASPAEMATGKHHVSDEQLRRVTRMVNRALRVSTEDHGGENISFGRARRTGRQRDQTDERQHTAGYVACLLPS